MSSDVQVSDTTSWYKDAVIYELHVKAFYDSAGDGIGDFAGLTSKLDYLKDLGVTAVWLLPFYPSPLKDDGYDIADYHSVHQLYGALKDFKTFLREAHKRGLRVITELVLNHTSDQHPWFARSRKAGAGSKWRNFYVWSDTANRYQEARIIFKDFEASNWTWDQVAAAYFWHRFYSHQPDLNFEDQGVRKAMLGVVSYWLRMGVDGLRLDAVPYLYEREGTNCENLPETHDFLKALRSHIDSKFKDRMLLAEANQWPSDAAAYFGRDDECNMAFHFPLMPRMFMAIQMEERFPVIDILEQTPSIPERSQWALFLRNHDELTLEMVTDEERDFMYRSYAKDKHARINLGIRRRLAPLLGNDRRKIELMNVLLFTFPGTPVVYYGDEIGMGDNFYLGDRNGVRTPMQWNADLNAGFSRTNPQKLYLPVIIEPQYHYEAINVENQLNDPNSLLVWMKKVIAIRKHFRALGRGSMEFLFPENPKILAYLRRWGDEILLVAANLSKQPQFADLDLSLLEGYLPREVFSGTSFSPIGKASYRLTFTPYAYYAFTLTRQTDQPKVVEAEALREITVPRRVDDVLKGTARERFESEVLPAFLSRSRWFGGKARPIERVRIRDVIRVESIDLPSEPYHGLIVDVEYTQGLPDAYFLPLAYRAVEQAGSTLESRPESVLAKLNVGGKQRIVLDAVYDQDFQRSILRYILRRRTSKGDHGVMRGIPRRRLVDFLQPDKFKTLESRLLKVEQSNSSIVYEDHFILKLFRKIEEGLNPEVEIGDVLTEQSFGSTPALLGSMQYEQPDLEPATMAILQEYVRNEGDAWRVFTEEFSKFLERIIARTDVGSPSEMLEDSGLLALAEKDLQEKVSDLVGHVFLDKASLLGRRTGEFHLALLKETENPDFKFEPFSQLYLMSLSQSMTSYANRVFGLARSFSPSDVGAKGYLDGLLKHRDVVLRKLTALKQEKIDSVRTRVHGDYHLGQVLFTGKDFVIIDYEGEPARSLSDRRLKRSPIRDVAGMIRSFHYAVYSVLMKSMPTTSEAIIPRVEDWAEFWCRAVSAAFLRAYLETVAGTPIVPKRKEALGTLLDGYLLEKAVYELGYEMNNRPAWAIIPLKGISGLAGLKPG